MSNVEYLIAPNGTRRAVQIPIELWEALQAELKELRKQREENYVRQSLIEAFEDIKQMKQGGKPVVTAEEFLKELDGE